VSTVFSQLVAVHHMNSEGGIADMKIEEIIDETAPVILSKVRGKLGYYMNFNEWNEELTVNSRTRMARKVSCRWESYVFHMSGGSMYYMYITSTGSDQKHPRHVEKHRRNEHHTWL
jgi:hypothetical protein